MNNITRSLLFLSVTSIIFTLILPRTVNASPGFHPPYYSRPTQYTETGGVSVDDPTFAYDLDNTTYARFRYDPGTAGSFEVKTFNTTATTEPIGFVDFKIRYKSDAGGTGEQYRIVYYVGTYGPVVLQDWTGAAVSENTYVWMNQREPQDGVWDWNDISNIRVIVETTTGGAKAAYFYEYEVWVSIYTYSVATMYVDPTSLTNPSSPFTVDINITGVQDLYGWEFRLYYNSTLLNGSSVSEGPFLSSAGSTWFRTINFTDNYNATHGIVWLTCTLLGDVQGVTGSGDLASITFKTTGQTGTTLLNLDATKLTGYDYQNKRLTLMSHNAVDGSVTISVPVPEFPFGAALEIALIGVITYLWWKGKRKQPRRLLGSSGISPK